MTTSFFDHVNKKNKTTSTKKNFKKNEQSCIMTQTYDHEHRHSSFSQPDTMVSYVGVQTPVQLFFSNKFTFYLFTYTYIYISIYIYTSTSIYKNLIEEEERKG